ncbi:MAG: FkbM family methyltransferase [Bacteroidetes bacterium]|nr:FkbM family methyltransferase [Bacteroidota bacterium]
MQLIREILKPAFRYMRDRNFREYLRVKNKCRNVKAGKNISLRVMGYHLETNHAAAFLHQYETIVRDHAFDFVNENNSPLIYSIGTNIGLEIFYLRKKYPAAKIRAFEADKNYAELLKKNLAANSITGVEVITAAVWIEKGTVSFRPDGALGGKINTGSEKIPSVRLRDEINGEKKIDLLIMDIEGAELKVLEDCSDVLHQIENIFVEWHGERGERQQLPRLLELLSAAHFHCRFNNNIASSPFRNTPVENGFDSMLEIFATRK